MKVKKGFSLLEVTLAILTMGLTVVALLNLLQWSNLNYKNVSTSWKVNELEGEIRVWLREQILTQNNSNPSLEQLKKHIKCPKGFKYSELTVRQHDSNTSLVKLGIYEDKNNNNKADSDEITTRLFCFRRRMS